MENATLIVVIIILAALLVLREWQNRSERRELLDRVMCRDFQEYRKVNGTAAGKTRPHVLPGRMSDVDLAAARQEPQNDA